jgi:CHAT domain-containing protein/Tfp pilus assembly protein PilF
MGQSFDETKRINQQVDQLYNQGRYQEAIPIAKRALAIYEKALGPYSPDVANSLNNLADLYRALGDYATAEPLFKRALAIYEKALGPEYPGVAIILNNLALLYKAIGDYATAESLHKRALAIREKAVGPEHPDVATSLGNLAGIYYSLGDYATAGSLYKRVLAIYEKALGPKHPDVATSLNNLAVIYITLGDYATAEPLYKRALAIYENVLGSEHPDIAQSLNNLASLYEILGDYAKAEPLYKRALAIRENALGPEHPDVADSLNTLAMLYKTLGNYAKAIPIAKRALEIHEKAFVAEHPDVATSLNNLALLYNALGDYAKAEPLYKRALAIYENVLGPKHPDVATSLNNLALLYDSLGNYAKAEPLYKRALAIREKTLGPEHPSVAASLNNLAPLYKSLGDYAKAEPLFKRALAIREKTLGPEHPDVADSLNNLAVFYYYLGDYAKAEPLYKRALAIDEKALGPEHPSVAASLSNLAALYYSLGDYVTAGPLHKRALAIREKALGSEHPDVATNLSHLALLYRALGDYVTAELLYKRALAIYEKVLGPEHPSVANSLSHLAALYLADGKADDAFKIFKKQDSPMGLGACYLARSDYKKAKQEFQRSFEHTQKSGEKKFIITDYIGLGLSYEGIRDLEMAGNHFKKAIDVIEAQWQTLGLSAKKTFLAGQVGINFSRLDAYEGMARVIIKEKKPGYEKASLLYAERVKSRTLLEMLAVKGAKGVSKKDREILARDRKFQQEIAMLRKRQDILASLGSRAPKGEKEQVDKTLNRVRKDYEQFINEVKFQDVELASLITVEDTPVKKIQALLDPSTTILEYFTTKDKTYAWLITRGSIKVSEIDLGKKPLLAMVNDLLLPNISNKSRRPEPKITISTGGDQAKETTERERKKNREQFLKATRDFYRSLLMPVEAGIRTDRLIIVPHGALHKVPFAALNDGRQFMVDRYAISVVPSSSVIEYVVKKRNKDQGRFLAFANPETDYVPLGFAEIEVTNIKRLFPKNEIYSRTKATEAKAKARSASPDIIHFACHGEFNDRQPMQSGLLLSKDKDNDGCLQVHEIFGLDLKNANLVTLSACDTALSRIYGGDDMVGLSRGFIYAGTPSILATLWKVDDRSTSILMEAFYDNWLNKGMNKPEALRQAQITLKSIPAYKQPYYWAPFVMIGDWM